MGRHTVLLVEDNRELQDVIRENLEAEGYRVVPASSARELREILGTVQADVILLDLVLPDADGLSLMSHIRAQTDAPVMIVSGRSRWVDKVVGLEMGADDYLVKPFEMHELAARIKAHIRRYRRDRAVTANHAIEEDLPRIRFGGLVMDRAQFQLFDDKGESLDLTVMEFRLLEALVSSPNRVFSREQLLDRARQDNPDIYDRAIDVQIARIRKKIAGRSNGCEYIRTVRGAGYMFIAATELAV